MVNRVVVSLLVIIISIMLAVTARAAGVETSSAIMGVDVVSSCMVETVNVDFGSYSGIEIRIEGDVRVRCTVGTVYSIALDAGANLVGLWRGIVSGSGVRMDYGIFKLPNYTGLWGDNDHPAPTSGFGSSLADTAGAGWQSHTVYSKLFGNQSTSAGTYSDTVNVTVHY